MVSTLIAPWVTGRPMGMTTSSLISSISVLFSRQQCNEDYVEILNIHTDQSKQLLGRYVSY